MKRILGIALVTVVGGFALTHYSIATKIEHRLDQLASAATGIGTLSYGQVWVTPWGEARVHDIVFYPYSTSANFHINTLAVQADSLKSLYRLGRSLNRGEVPQSLSVSLEGVEFDMGTALLSPLLEGADARRQPGDFFASGCGERTRFSYADLDAMGYRSAVSDMRMAYQLSPDKTQMTLTGDFSTRGMYGLSYGFDVEFPPVDQRGPEALMNGTRLRRAELTLVDSGYTEQVLDFCGHETGLDRAGYRARHLAAWSDNWRKMYVAPGAGMIAAYDDFLHQPGTIKVQSYTPLALLDAMQSSSPQTLLEQLNPQISVNDAAPRALRIQFATTEWNERKREKRSVAATSGSSQAPASAGSESVPATTRDRPRPIELGQLEQYLGQPVMIKLRDGRTFSGEIIEITDFEPRKLQFKQTIHNGTMVMPLELGQIATVYRL